MTGSPEDRLIIEAITPLIRDSIELQTQSGTDMGVDDTSFKMGLGTLWPVELATYMVRFCLLRSGLADWLVGLSE